MKNLYIAEKPSVAAEFAKALGVTGRKNGYIENDTSIVTWCVGHLVTMSYPEVYDPRLKRWSMDALPFIPKEYKYEVIEDVKGQFETVKSLLNREDVGCIYICTDSGREGEYIYRLVDMMAGVKDKTRKRVWIDSQTEEEILRGIREAKDWSEYDNLASSAFLRAKEDYLMGINFSRLLTLKYGNTVSNVMKSDRVVISVGRVMTCVLGMVVRREREVRNFVKTPFFRVITELEKDNGRLSAEWKSAEGSEYFESPKLYKENGFKKKDDAELLSDKLKSAQTAVVTNKEKKKETKNPPLLNNLAEIQNDCSKRFKISPDETLKIIQELYEKKLVTYPRTDARVLSSAVAKEIQNNIGGLKKLGEGPGSIGSFAREILEKGMHKNIGKTRYTNDSLITDHYAIIPTGQGFGALSSLSPLSRNVYELICRRFLSIFYPAAIYEKIQAEFTVENGEYKEKLTAGGKILKQKGYLVVTGDKEDSQGKDDELNEDAAGLRLLDELKKGDVLSITDTSIKEGETTPPKRYTSGSMILAMENAGQLIEDEELRSQIKGSGIGTSATRAEILKKLMDKKYLTLNKKTQVITPTLLGEMIYEVVYSSIRSLLNPELTASWEKGLSYVSEGSITSDEYMEKMDNFVVSRTNSVLQLNNQYAVKQAYEAVEKCYEKK